jgi:hypothetical protein
MGDTPDETSLGGGFISCLLQKNQVHLPRAKLAAHHLALM